METEQTESAVEPCECPNCDDPHNGSECMRNFCVVCRREVGDDGEWGRRCDRCIEWGYTEEGGR